MARSATCDLLLTEPKLDIDDFVCGHVDDDGVTYDQKLRNCFTAKVPFASERGLTETAQSGLLGSTFRFDQPDRKARIMWDGEML